MEKLKSAIAPSNREAIAKALYQCVSETAVTTMLAQNYHWNVTGMAFGPLHNLFQEIYEDHFADVIRMVSTQKWNSATQKQYYRSYYDLFKMK